MRKQEIARAMLVIADRLAVIVAECQVILDEMKKVEPQ